MIDIDRTNLPNRIPISWKLNSKSKDCLLLLSKTDAEILWAKLTVQGKVDCILGTVLDLKNKQIFKKNFTYLLNDNLLSK